ncbi:MAG: ABC transporter ATP-binding protein [Lachnospiraceae bacterium]|nr:ABC transporter ATP-binding protein [Lachnospiraceae bacterium]
MENIVEAKNLTKRYQSCMALQQVNLTVKRGEIYGLVGANGAGKTTFLKLLAGQIFPSEGEFTLFGAHQQRAQEKQRMRTGAIIEMPGFVPQLTIEQNMEYYRRQKGIPGDRVIEDTLKTVGLWEVRKKRAKTLSLGMKQRLGLAIALMGEPELLLLDEPINGLDPSGIIEMRNLLKKLNQEKNMTIIISSHILSELEQLATVYGFLDKGRMLEQLSARQLHEKCGNYLEIVVTDVEKYIVLLEKKLQHKDYLVLADGTVRIYGLEKDAVAYSALASENGIGIRGMSLKQNSLEDYYMSITKGGRENA